MGYNVYRGGVFVRQVLAPSTSMSDTGLAASTVYSYAVTAVDGAGNVSGMSATASTNTPACPDTTPPTTPTGLTAVGASCSQVNLSWSPSTDAGGSGLLGYNVYRGGAFLKQVVAPTTSTSDLGLTASTTYGYAVAAVDNAGNASAASATVSATTPACTGVVNPTLVGFVPGVGTAHDVVIDAVNHLAYVASAEFGLSVVDVSTPTQPVPLGAANPAFSGERVALAGSLATVSGGTAGLYVVDVSNHAAPKTVGSLAGTYWAVAMSGQYAYAAQVVAGNPAHTDLVVVNLSIPSAPVVTGRVTVAGGTGLKVIGNYAYVSTGSGVQVVNVSNPAVPVIATTLTTGTSSGVLNGAALAISGSYAYMAMGTALQVLNIGTPLAPSLVATLNVSANDVAVDGTRLYVIGGTAFEIVDVSNPAAPAVLGTSNAQGAQGVAAAGTVAYLASPNVNVSTNMGGLYVWNVATPSSPSVLANYTGVFDNWGVAVAGTAAVETGNTFGLKVVDLSVPTAPKVRATMAGVMRGVAMAGQYAYVMQLVSGNPGYWQLVVMNVSNPAAPAITAQLRLQGGGAIRVVGSYAYVFGGGLLQVINVSNPAAPAVVGTVTTGGTGSQLAVAGNYVYVADASAFRVISVATPTLPVVVGSYATTSATAVAVSGSRAYVIDYLSVDTFDVSVPSTPQLLGTESTYSGQGIDAQGNVVFLVTMQSNYMTVIDTTTPAAPVLVRKLRIPGGSQSVTSTSTYAYAGDVDSIVDVVQLTP